MADEQNVQTNEQTGMQEDYISAINKLKNETVSKTEYDDMKSQNKRLLEALVNGGGQKTDETPEPPKASAEDIKRMRNELFNPEADYSNLEYVKRTLELRKALMENGSVDPFVPVGKQINPSRDDIEAAERCATVYQECIDYAQGDSEAFTTELMRRTRDVGRIR